MSLLLFYWYTHKNKQSQYTHMLKLRKCNTVLISRIIKVLDKSLIRNNINFDALMFLCDAAQKII